MTTKDSCVCQDDDTEIQIYVPEGKGVPSGDQPDATKDTQEEQDLMSREKTMEDVVNQNEPVMEPRSEVMSDSRVGTESPLGERTEDIVTDTDTAPSQVVRPERVRSTSHSSLDGDTLCPASQQDLNTSEEFQPASERGECCVEVLGVVSAGLRER